MNDEETKLVSNSIVVGTRMKCNVSDTVLFGIDGEEKLRINNGVIRVNGEFVVESPDLEDVIRHMLIHISNENEKARRRENKDAE